MKRFLATTALLALAACAPAATTPPNADGSSSSVFLRRSFALETARYESMHGFSLTATTGATVWEDEEYVRLQNYPPDKEGIELAPGEYYVEVHVATDPSDECADGVAGATEVTVDGVTGYRGMGQPGGDAGGQRFALCLESGDRQYFVMATENAEEARIANAILDSFRLTR